MRRAVWIGVAFGLIACGGGGSQATEGEGEGEGETSSSGSEASASAERPDWHDMDHQQRAQFMAEVVVPEMQTLFAEFDGERFAEVSCATCHGANAREVAFHMPNGLAPLDPTQIPAMFASEEPMHVFMTRTVWPRMGELLGEELYDAERGTGFSCRDCHATRGE